MDEWISIRDQRKPPEGDIVLVISMGKKLYATYSKGLGFFYCEPPNILHHALCIKLPEVYSRIDIEWWFPQPEPPK